MISAGGEINPPVLDMDMDMPVRQPPTNDIGPIVELTRQMNHNVCLLVNKTEELIREMADVKLRLANIEGVIVEMRQRATITQTGPSASRSVLGSTPLSAFRTPPL